MAVQFNLLGVYLNSRLFASSRLTFDDDSSDADSSASLHYIVRAS